MNLPPFKVKPNDGEHVWIEVQPGEWEEATLDSRFSKFNRKRNAPLSCPGGIICWNREPSPPPLEDD